MGFECRIILSDCNLVTGATLFQSNLSLSQLKLFCQLVLSGSAVALFCRKFVQMSHVNGVNNSHLASFHWRGTINDCFYHHFQITIIKIECFRNELLSQNEHEYRKKLVFNQYFVSSKNQYFHCFSGIDSNQSDHFWCFFIS